VGQVRTQALHRVQVLWSISIPWGIKTKESWGHTPTQAPQSKQSWTVNFNRFPAAFQSATILSLVSSAGIVGGKY